MTYLDGAALLGEQISQMAGFTDRIRNFPYVQTVRGGRHTLSMFPDATDAVVEGDETNNIMGAQYVWSPLALTSGATLERAAPPGADGRLRRGDGLELGARLVQLRRPAHAHAGAGGRHGAVGWRSRRSRAPRATSTCACTSRSTRCCRASRSRTPCPVWGPAESDYVLVNFRATTPRVFDVGVLGINGAESLPRAVGRRRPGWPTSPQATTDPSV